MLRSLNRSEKYFLGAVVIVLLLLITLPYLWVWTVTPDGFHYGGLLYNPDDQNVHLAWARQAMEGHFAVTDVFTTESLDLERPLFFNLYTWAMGTTARLTHIPLILVSHFFRLIFAALAIVWFYSLCSRLTKNRLARGVAVALAAFSTGIGFLLPLFPNHILMDNPGMVNFPMMPEAYTFTSAFIFGLNIVSLALLILVYERLLRAEELRSWKPAFVAIIAAFIVANIHTYDAFPMLIVLAFWFLWRLFHLRSEFEKSTFSLGIVFSVIIAALTPILYQVWVFVNDPQFRLKAVTYTQAPPIFDVILSYGIVSLLAIVGIVFAARRWRTSKRQIFLVVWVIATLAFIYLPRWMGHPLSFERKMIEGIHWPLCLLAALGLVGLLQRIKIASVRQGIAAAVIIICSISSFQFIGWTLANAQDNNASRAHVMMSPLYLTTGDAAAMDYLREHGDREKAVLCLTYIGNYVPQRSGMTVYLGHWAETIDYKVKLSQTVRFLTGGMENDDAAEWLDRHKIGYVIVGSYENQLGVKLPLPLEAAFSEAGTTVYKVK